MSSCQNASHGRCIFQPLFHSGSPSLLTRFEWLRLCGGIPSRELQHKPGREDGGGTISNMKHPTDRRTGLNRLLVDDKYHLRSCGHPSLAPLKGKRTDCGWSSASFVLDHPHLCHPSPSPSYPSSICSWTPFSQFLSITFSLCVFLSLARSLTPEIMISLPQQSLSKVIRPNLHTSIGDTWWQLQLNQFVLDTSSG